MLPDPPGCWAQEWLPHPLPQLSLVASFMFHPTLWLKAPALGGGQISPSHGRGPGKLQGEQGPGCRRSVGRGQNSRTPCNYGLGRFPRSVLTPCLFQRAHSLRGIVGWYTGPRVLTRLRAPGHTPSISLSPPPTPSKVRGTRTGQDTQNAGQETHTHARPSDVNKPRTHRPRAPVQGLFSQSHVLALTAPRPAWADADARWPALPLPARLLRRGARAPKRGPSPRTGQTCFGRVTVPPDLCLLPLSPHASRPGEVSAGAPTEWTPALRPRHVPGSRRPRRLGAPRARPASEPATLTRLSACFAWRPGHAWVPLLSQLLSWPEPCSVSPLVPIAGRFEPSSSESRAEFCCGAGSAGGRAEL